MSRRAAGVVLLAVVASGCDQRRPAARSDAPRASIDARAPQPQGGPSLSGAPSVPLEPFGIAECDAYIARYRSCLSRIAAVPRAILQRQLSTTVEKWRQGVRDPQIKKQLARTCSTAEVAAAAAMKAVGCAWP